MDDLLSRVLVGVKPSNEEVKRLEIVSSKIINLLKNSAAEEGVSAEVLLGGSAARGTWMSGNHDLDFFMRFPDESSILKHYKSIVKKCFKSIRMVHGTRDYFKLTYEGCDVEIIPSVKYDSPGKASNSTDISYFHIKYLLEKFENNSKLRNEVLLLKQFMKANEVYGAESARGGFSGYVCELLIVYYKSLKNLFKAFDTAKPKIIIDLNSYYKSADDLMNRMDKNKLSGPLIIVDPLLPDRNAAACVTYTCFSEFLFRVRYFLRENDIKLFNIRGLSTNLVRERSRRRGTKLLIFSIKNLSSDFDVTKAKLLRKVKQLTLDLNKEGWSVYNYGVTSDKKLFIEFESLKVSKSKKHYGPFVWVEPEHFEQFFKKWKGNALGKPYAFENKLVVDVYRKSDVKEIVKEYLKEYIC